MDPNQSDSTDAPEATVEDSTHIGSIPPGFHDYLKSSVLNLSKYVLSSPKYEEEIKELLEELGILEIQKLTLVTRTRFENFVKEHSEEIITEIEDRYLLNSTPQKLEEGYIDLKTTAEEFKKLSDIILNPTENIQESSKDEKVKVIERLSELRKLVLNINSYLELFYDWSRTPWGSFRSKAGSLVIHDFRKPLGNLLPFLGLILDDPGELEDRIELFISISNDERINLKGIIQETIAETLIMAEDIRSELKKEDSTGFSFTQMQSTLSTKLNSKNEDEDKPKPKLNLIINGELAKNYSFPNFEAWMTIHTFVLNALDNGAKIVTVEVDNSNPNFFSFKIIDDIKPHKWGEVEIDFLNAYELGKKSPYIPWTESRRGGQIGSYLVGQNFSINQDSKYKGELLDFVDAADSKWIDLKFPKK